MADPCPDPCCPCPDPDTCPATPQEMGFSDAVSKALADAKVDAGLLWVAIQKKGTEARDALHGVFHKLLGL